MNIVQSSLKIFKCGIYMRSANRTNNRIRSLRFITFRSWDKIGEGNRQIGSVTLEKGLALLVLSSKALLCRMLI